MTDIELKWRELNITMALSRHTINVPDLLSKLKDLLDKGANIDSFFVDLTKVVFNNNFPVNALMCACQGNRPEVVEFLLKNGAKVNASNTQDYRAMGMCLLSSKIKCLKLLLENNADPNYTNPFNPLEQAINDGEGNGIQADVIDLLLKHNANIHLYKTYYNPNLLFEIVKTSLWDKNCLIYLKKFIQLGLNPFELDDKNRSLLWIVSKDYTDDIYNVMDFLVLLGLNPYQKDNNGVSALDNIASRDIAIKLERIYSREVEI